MTPSLPDILTGHAVALSTPLPQEASGAYFVGRIGMLTMLSLLAAQEAERGLAATVWENGALRALFTEAAPRYDDALAGALARRAAERDEDLSLGALGAANAALRCVLIALHEAVEAGADAPLHHRILTLYAQMAAARRLDLPAAPG